MKFMKKIGIMFFALAITSCANKIEEQKFVNPLFYETLQPLSTQSWRTNITPTSMTRNNKGTVLKQKCTLIENTMEAVTLQCEGAYDPENILQYRFTPDLEVKGYNGTFVWMYYKNPDENKYVSHMSFIIDNRN